MAASDPNDKVYSTNKLSKWFAIGSLLLLLAVIWALLEDYDRDWKHYNRQAKKIAAAIGEKKLNEAQGALDQSKLAGIQTRIGEIDKENARIEGELQGKIKHRQALYYKANQDFQFLKAQLDADLFQLEHAIKERHGDVLEKKKNYDKLAKEVGALKRTADAAELARDHALEDEVDLQAQKKALSDEYAGLTRERERLKKIIAQNDTNLQNILRNAPVVDFVSPTVKISQVVLPHLKDDYFFNKVPRVDRCMTCHATIDKAGFEKFPQPFTSHPNLNRMVGPDSPHPLEKIGCTVCHAGSPQSVDFTLAAHTPRDLKQEAEWHKKYNYHRSEHIGTPMVPLQMTEGKCLQCHAKQVELDGAPTFNAGMRMIEKYGCWGCHKMNEHFEKLSKEKKVGPQLKTVASKVSEEWIKKWLWDPTAFRPSTTMPRFWKNHNNSDPASLARGAVEVDAITAYLLKKSTPYTPIAMASSAVADAAKGKELVSKVGCLGCHANADFPRVNPKDPKALGYKDPRVPMFGPELNQMGSKVSKEWLYSWLINPKHYWEGSAMPSLKLSPSEAASIAEYLLSKRNLGFEAAKAPEADEKVRDQIVKNYLDAVLTPKESQTKLASMSLDEKKQFLGEKLISHYGCYGCHAIEGFEKATKVGAELTYEGSKDVSKFSFENVEIPEHSRAEWVYTKIRTPRIWDVGKNRDFESKTKMPQFSFTSEQATAIASIVLGLENKNVDDEAMFKVDGRWEQIIRGQELVRKNNCIGCHAIEKKGGEILAHYPQDITLGPPNLNTEGRKVQTDWLYRFLANPTVMIRPWLEVRMPQYHLSDPDIMDITKYFAALDKASYPYDGRAEALSGADEKAAAALFNQQGCLTCHAVRKPGEDVSAAAPHLANVKARLRAPWVVDWIRDPSAIMPGTRMPTLWPSTNDDDPKAPRVAIPGYFGDDAEKQIHAIRNFLYGYGGPATVPPARDGLGVEPAAEPAATPAGAEAKAPAAKAKKKSRVKKTALR